MIKYEEYEKLNLPMLMNGQVSFGSSSLRGTKQSDQESIKNILGLVAKDGEEYKKEKINENTPHSRLAFRA
jgi:type I restriction enzyme S subunit